MATTKSSHRPPEKRITKQSTNQLTASNYFHHMLIIGAIRNIVCVCVSVCEGGGGGGVGGRFRGSSNRVNSTPINDVGETNLKCSSDFCHLCFILVTKVATNKKSISAEEYTITHLFNTFTISLMTSFYQETYKLSVISKKKSLCSGVLQSLR